MKEVFVLPALAVLLTSCAVFCDGDSSNMQPEGSSLQFAVGESKESAQNQTFNAQIIDYSDGVLIYVTDSQHKAQTDPHCFENDTNTEGGKLLSERIIAKCKTEKIYADIRLDKSGDRIVSCDVISCNGEYFDNLMLNKGGETIESDEASMRRISGSIFEIYKGSEKLTADINDLESYYKADFPDQIDRMIFEGYRLNSGSFILLSISVFSGIDEMGSYIYDPPANENKYSFFGTIREISGDRAEFLLSDKKTVCDVPCCYTDGELKDGMQVMVTLNAPAALYGSGDSYKDEFAVFHTDANEYDPCGYGFDELAYAQYSNSQKSRYIYTNKNEI